MLMWVGVVTFTLRLTTFLNVLDLCFQYKQCNPPSYYPTGQGGGLSSHDSENRFQGSEFHDRFHLPPSLEKTTTLSWYYSPAVPIATLSCFPPSSSPSPFSSVCFSPSPAFVSTLQNGRAFQQFLDDTWPEITLRRGSAVIRNTLYEKIAETLRGGETTARLKHWVKKSEFFLIGACLAVPAVRGRLDAGKLKGAASYSLRLVARLENFSHIIAFYHNDQMGHRGIRKTYAMVPQESKLIVRPKIVQGLDAGCGESIVGEAPLPKGCGGGGGWKCKKWAMHILESPQIIEKCYTAFSAYYLRGCVENEGSIDGCEESIDGCEVSIDGCEESIDGCEVSIDGCEESIDGCEVSIDGCEESIDGCEGSIDGCEESIDGCEGSIDGCEGSIDGCEESIDGCEVSIDGCEVSIDGCEESIDGCEESIDGCEGSIDGCEGSIDGCEGSIDRCEGPGL
eukprot:Em0112g9a